jgi:hypothetical protein
VAPVLLSNSRLCKKLSPGTNGLAYFGREEETFGGLTPASIIGFQKGGVGLGRFSPGDEAKHPETHLTNFFWWGRGGGG